MKSHYEEFIGIYRDVYPGGFCKHIIKEFDKLEEEGAGYNRVQGENAPRHHKNDYQIFCGLRDQNFKLFENREISSIFFDGLQKCFLDYTGIFSSLKDSPIRASTMKMQKTSPGGGYHIFHPEQGPGEMARRVLTYMLYLNTIAKDGGGETEFLYQRKRYHPEENVMLLWPAAYTHTHRGNTVLSDEYKYVITGWFYYD